MSKHKHAENMLLYAQDAMETDKPWERWEFRGEHEDSWKPLQQDPMWWALCEYRRKPQVIIVNGIEVPAPEKKAPKRNTRYYVANLTDRELYHEWLWVNDAYNKRMLERGLIHLTKEAAIAHAKAMLAWKKGERGND